MFQDPQACRNLHGYEDGTWVPSRRIPARTILPLSGWRAWVGRGRKGERGRQRSLTTIDQHPPPLLPACLPPTMKTLLAEDTGRIEG